MKKMLIIILIIVFFPVLTYGLVIGDIDGDGYVKASDYVLIRKHIMDTVKLNTNQVKIADINSDGKINAQDYILVKKIIMGTYKPDKKSYTISLISEVTTGFEDKNILIKGGEVSEQRSVKLHFKKNIHYTISFDYQAKAGNNVFDVDIYPDDITQSYPKKANSAQVNLMAMVTKKHYDWEIALDDARIATDDIWLRFFDDIDVGTGSDITISNISMKKIEKLTYKEGDKYGNLPTPVRGGYKFDGWYTESVGGTKITSDMTVNSDITLYPHWKHSFDLILMWGQSNMVGGVGHNFETGNNTSSLKGVDADIIYNNKSYGRVLVNMPADVAYEYRYLSNSFVDISLNVPKYGEILYYNNGELSSNKISESYSVEESIGTNMIPYFAQEYYNQTGNRLVIVHTAKGSMPIRNFLPDSNTNIYKSIVLKYKAAEKYINSLGFEINNRFYVVYQGESDMYDGILNNYASTYKTVHDSFKKDLGLSFGAIVYMVRGDLPCDNTLIEPFRNQQKKLVKENDDIIMGTDFLYQEYCGKGNNTLFGVKTATIDNSIHVNSAGLSQVGRNTAKNIWYSNKIK